MTPVGLKTSPWLEMRTINSGPLDEEGGRRHPVQSCAKKCFKLEDGTCTAMRIAG